MESEPSRDNPPQGDPAPRDATKAPEDAPKNRDRYLVYIGALASFGFVVLSYLPNFRSLADTWLHDDNYNYAFLVPLIAAAIFRQRCIHAEGTTFEPSLWGFPVLAAVLVLRAYAFEANQLWLESATIPLAMAALTLLVGGRGAIKVGWPALVYLYLMIPIPERINSVLAFKLQSLATVASTSVLQTLGRPAISQGNIILMSGYHLEVARACSGLSMLLTFFALMTAVAFLSDREVWQRLLVFSSAIPVALASNVVRIVLTALAYPIFGPLKVEKFAHDFAGWLMMPVGLLFIWIGYFLIDWIVVEDKTDEKQKARASIVGFK